jgi:hypothetical protein
MPISREIEEGRAEWCNGLLGMSDIEAKWSKKKIISYIRDCVLDFISNERDCQVIKE